jgi:hypothetical protein
MTAAQITELNQLLSRITERLSGPGCMNYGCWAQVWYCPGMAGAEAERIVQLALGEETKLDAQFKPVHSVIEAVIEDVKSSLEHPGTNDCQHPSMEYLNSMDFSADLKTLLNHFQCLLSEAQCITSISIAMGHPFSVAYWDAQYIIEKGADAYLFIASSSD